MEIIEEMIRKLLYDDVIDNTYHVMLQLRGALAAMATRRETLTQLERAKLVKILEPLVSESIREALHKGELHITNAIIKHKNTILTACGVKIEEWHQEIDPKQYNHNW